MAHHRPNASADLGSLIAETERLMSAMGAGGGQAAAPATPVQPTGDNTASTITRTIHTTREVRSPVRLTTSSSSVTHTSTAYDAHKSQLQSTASSAALRSLSPRPAATTLGRARLISPHRSPTRATSAYSAVPHRSPLSPREQARREMSRSGMRSPRLTSPIRAETTAPSSIGFGASSSFRASSASPSRFRSVVDAGRAAAVGLDATLRYENLIDTPAPTRGRSRQASPIAASSPIRSPTRFSTARPSPIHAASMRPDLSASFVHAPLEPWRELNRQLSLNGFAMVAPFPVPSGTQAEMPWSPNSTRLFRHIPTQSPPAALQTLLTNFTSLLADYGRRGETIQELMNKTAAENSSHAHCHAELTIMRRTNLQQADQIRSLQQSLESSSAERASTLKSLTVKIDQSAAEFAALDLKYHQAVRETQQRAEEVRDARRKIDEQQARHERQSAQERDRFQAAVLEQELVATNASQCVRDLERQLQECQLALLSSQNANRDLETAAIKREQHHSQVLSLKTTEAEEQLHSIAVAHDADRAAARQKLHDVELDWSTRTRNLEDQLTVADHQNADLNHANQLLRSDLASAQSHGLMQEEQVRHVTNEKRLQAELISELEKKIAGLQAQAIHGYNIQELSKYLDSFQTGEQLLRREDLAASFEAQQVHRLPQEVLAQIVLSVCVKLNTNDATNVVDALDQLIGVASAVPGMQEFIAQIWGILSGADSASAHELTPANLVALTTSVMPTLKAWQESNEQVADLQRFRLDVLDALRRRVHRSPLNPLHSASGAGSAAVAGSKLHDALPNEEIVFELTDIVSNENRLNALVYDQHASPSSFFQLWAQMDKSPLVTQPHSQDPEKIIAHIQQLFDVPHRIGLFPKMNELFLFVNETRPAIQAMRSLLGLDSRATIHTCIKTLRKLVDGAGPDAFGSSLHASRSFSPARSSVRHESNGRGLAWTVTSPSKTETSFLNSTSMGGSSAPSQDQMQRNAQYWSICKQVKALTGAKKMSDIVGAVSTLSARAAQTDFLSASILTQLVSMLEVGDMTQLPSAVTRLRGRVGDLERQVESANRQGSAGQVAQELSQQLAAKRDEFIANLKQIVGVAGESDAALVNALMRLINDRAAGGSSAPSPSQKEHQLIVTQLRGYLDVGSSSDIVSTVRTLIKKLHSYDEIYPQLDNIISRLYEMLHVGQLDDIVPAVRRLCDERRTTGGASSYHADTGAGSLAASIGRGASRPSVENSPALSAISDVSSVPHVASSHINPYSSSSSRIHPSASPSTASAAAPITTTHTSTVSRVSTSSLRVNGPSSTPARVTFDDDALSAYAPSTSSDQRTSARDTHAQLEREIDDAIARTKMDEQRRW